MALNHGPVTALALTESQLFAARNGIVSCYDLATGALITARRLLSRRIHALVVDDARIGAVGARCVGVRDGDATSERPVETQALDAAFDGGELVVALASGKIESATRVVADASDAFGELRSGSLRPPADLCGGDAFGRLVVVERGRVSFVDDAHGGVVTSTRWAGEAILSTSDDRTVKLWRRDGASFALAWAGRGHGARCWHAAPAGPHHVVSCSSCPTAEG